MGHRTYKATGVFLRALESVLKLNLRVSGQENLVDRPTLYVVNHFTRFETMLIPYAIYRCVKQPVRCLADHTLFKGTLGKYLRACGNVSTHEPLRNRMIIGDLMTGRSGWVIYPEGVMVKNKKIFENGRLKLDNPLRQGPPHTGAAVLALKAEMTKLLYQRAVSRGDVDESIEYAKRYHFKNPEDLSPHGTVIVPVTITYYPLRPDENLFLRLAKLLHGDLTARLEEELRVEGKMLLGDTDMSVHFGSPVEVANYLGWPARLGGIFDGLLSKQCQRRWMLKRPARRLTDRSLRSIYAHTEINFDHLFCYGLRALKKPVIAVDQFHRAMYLAATELQRQPGLRLHPHLQQDMTGLLAGIGSVDIDVESSDAMEDQTASPVNGGFAPLRAAVAIAKRCGVLVESSGQYHVKPEALHGPYDFHEVRLRNTVDVIANEVEAVTSVTGAVQRYVNRPATKLRAWVREAVHRADRERFHLEYQQSCGEDSCRPVEIGLPFFMGSTAVAKTGVVLTHGYLSAPAQMRPMADYLFQQGYSVYGVNLKGHGTVPTALSGVSWHDWIESIIRGAVAMREHCDRVVIGGFSLGGVLALYLAATQRGLVDAVFSINAPMRLRDWRFGAVGAVTVWNKSMDVLGLPLRAFESISNADSENPDINYLVHYPSGLWQVRQAMTACRRKLKEVSAPALVIQANQDPIVAPQSGQVIYENLGSREKYFVELESDRHVVVRDEGSEKVFKTVGSFLERLPAASSSAGSVALGDPSQNTLRGVDDLKRMP